MGFSAEKFDSIFKPHRCQDSLFIIHMCLYDRLGKIGKASCSLHYRSSFHFGVGICINERRLRIGMAKKLTNHRKAHALTV